MQTAKNLTSQGAWFHQIPAYLISHLAPLIVGLISVSLLPRVMGPDEYGTYALIVATASLAASIWGDWLVPSGIRLSSDRGSLVWEALGWIAFLFSLIGMLTVWALLIREMSAPVWMGAGLFATSMILSKPFVAYIRATLQRKLISGFSVVATLGSLLLSLGLYIVSKNLVWFIIGMGIVPWASFVIYSFKFKWFLGLPQLHIWKIIFRFGLPIAITSVGGQVLQFADRYIIAVFMSKAEVGIYNVTYNLAAKVLGLAFSIFFSSMYPIGSRAWALGKKVDAQSLLGDLSILTTTLSGTFIWFQAVSGVTLVRWLAGAPFSPPSLVPVLVAGGSWLWFIGILQHQPFEWDQHTLWITAMTLSAAGLNLILNWILVPLWGITGSAAATLASYASYLALCTFLSHKYYSNRSRVWQIQHVFGIGLGALILWYWFDGKAPLWQGVLMASVYGVPVGRKPVVMFWKYWKQK